MKTDDIKSIVNRDTTKNLVDKEYRERNKTLEPKINDDPFYETKNLLSYEWKKGSKDLFFVDKKPIDIMVLTYNRLVYLKKCLWSIWTNTLYPFRLIVVNNGSTDNVTEKFLDMLSEKLYNGRENWDFKVYHSIENLGTGKGKNFGIDKCESEIIAISDDDAWYNSGWLVKCMEVFDLFEKIVIVSIHNPGEPSGQRKKNELGTNECHGIKIVYRRTITPMHWVMKRDIIMNAGGFKDKKGRLMGYSGSAIAHNILHSGYKIAKVLDDRNEDGNRYVIPMDTRKCKMNEINRYEKSGYNNFRRGQKNIITKKNYKKVILEDFRIAKIIKRG